MKFQSNIDSSWCMKYIGVPLTLGFTMFGLLNHINLRKRREALKGKVSF